MYFLLRKYDYRKNQVIVQSFCENGIADYWEHIERYVQSGLDEILCLMETRHIFNLEPISAQDIKAEQHPAFHHLGQLVPRFSRCDDLGLRVLVDELAIPLMGFNSIVEIEFGRNHEATARELANQFKTKFGANLSEKEHNKIRYYLGK